MNQHTNTVATLQNHRSLSNQFSPSRLQDVIALRAEIDNAFETVLAQSFTPEAMAVLHRYQIDLSTECGLGEVISLRDALNDLGASDSYGLEVFLRTLKAIKKERGANE